MNKNELSIILLRPQMGENMGAAARVMQNFGLSDLRIVAPRDGWPNEAARSMATKAVTIIDGAPVFETLAEAIADRQLVFATTARERQGNKQAVEIGELRDLALPEKVAIVFGPERTGLENEDIALADQILYVTTSEENPSLNLAQAVAVVAYEWSRRTVDGSKGEADELAPKSELQGLFDHLEGELDKADFWKVASKKPIMWQNLRNSLQKARLNEQEVRSWRGVIRALCEYGKKS